MKTISRPTIIGLCTAVSLVGLANSPVASASPIAELSSTSPVADISSTVEQSSAPSISSTGDQSSAPSISSERTSLQRNATHQAIIDETNKARTENGKQELERNDYLTEEAQRRAEKLAANNEVVHYGLDDIEFGHGLVAENLRGTWDDKIDPQSEVQAWLDSPEHRKNLLNDTFTQIGIGSELASNNMWHIVALYSEL